MKGTPVTLKDIAKQLGITVATVSRALKGYPDISPQTKQAVIELAEKLHYRPNPIALNLRKNHSNIIGVIIPEIVHNFFSTVISGIMDVADAAGYSVIICQTNESYTQEVKEAGVLLGSRVDGLLISLSNETKQFDHLEEFMRLNTPIVLFDKICDELNTSKITVDDYEGAFTAIEHLILQGYQRIAIIKGHAYNSMERFRGYKAALEKYGMPILDELVFEGAKLHYEEGIAFAKQMMSMPQPPDAVLTVADWLAVGLLVGVKQCGKKVPQDMAIIGFNDWQVATALEPPLTSVYQPGFEMGQLAAKTLMAEIEANEKNQPYEPINQVLKTKLIIRESSSAKKEAVLN
ncbi:MAG: LacI family transcriptional regulator [Microscillaceae bacterium]|jgi:LacI family transcriptional regulator|nr:LacI family transcriptional regulator [Microscillaceae bacterium]